MFDWHFLILTLCCMVYLGNTDSRYFMYRGYRYNMPHMFITTVRSRIHCAAKCTETEGCMSANAVLYVWLIVRWLIPFRVHFLLNLETMHFLNGQRVLFKIKYVSIFYFEY